MNNYDDFLKMHSIKKSIGIAKEITHTKIGKKELQIYGASYSITEEEEYLQFLELYYNQVIVNKKKEYITEKQLTQNSPLLVDIDLKYTTEIKSRQHTADHILDMIQVYLENIKKIFLFSKETEFYIYIMEKPNVNILLDKNITKDGIHMVIGIQMEHTIQLHLRELIMKELNNVWSSLPTQNTIDQILDEGISKGSTNWQMYGSRKPENEAYQLTYLYKIGFDDSDSEFSIEPQTINETIIREHFSKLCARYSQHPEFPFHTNFILPIKNKKIKNVINLPSCISNKTSNIKEPMEDIIPKITNLSILNETMNLILDNFKDTEYYIKEIHYLTQVLPKKYYEPGSHLLNREVSFALKDTHEDLFLSWVMLRAKADDFDYDDIANLYKEWVNIKLKQNGITGRSIIYWAQQENKEEYLKIKNKSIDYYIDISIKSSTEFDIANVLYHYFKEKYICTSISNKKWYTFRNHKWECDNGQSLRLNISTELYKLYMKKLEGLFEELKKCEDDDAKELLTKNIKDQGNLMNKLKKTTDKNNIMRESMELFYDSKFIRLMDANKYLMCFSNGVVDFKKKEFRNGLPQDYITKSTNVPFLGNDLDEQIIEQINQFMRQLFPEPSVCKYMWEHLSSSLIGANINQTFNIYCGSGSNGKSILADLMSLSLGDYKGTVPISLVTEKRNKIGGTSSEVIQLKGIRYAVMQEPSKNSKVDEGVMKELTGGDPIQARALYSESEIFEPQFNLVVCTNNLPEITSNDDGTWRRIRVVPFISKFIDETDKFLDTTSHIFKKDKALKDKLPLWAPVFISKLVEIAYNKCGMVEDCEIVLSTSNKYREEQDLISAFINQMIVQKIGEVLKKSVLQKEFQKWFQDQQYGSRKPPKTSELIQMMDKMYPLSKKDKVSWNNLTICNLEQEDDYSEP
jgi:P4 family phage/plasmid primase-like protien